MSFKAIFAPYYSTIVVQVMASQPTTTFIKIVVVGKERHVLYKKAFSSNTSIHMAITFYGELAII